MFVLSVIVVVLVVLLYWHFIKPLNYWKHKNVKQSTLFEILSDNFGIILGRRSYAETWRQIYLRNKNTRYFGDYQLNSPVLVVRDPEIIKQITIKDFEHFTNHRNFASPEADPIWSRNIFALGGEKWRSMRLILSPTFTGSKMRTMFVLMEEAARKYIDFYKAGPRQFSLEVKDSYTRLSNDVIASCAFGVQCDSLKNRDNEFYAMGKEATNFSGFIKTIQFLIALTSPQIANLIRVEVFTKPVRTFFGELVGKNMKMREEQNIYRPDMIQLLMEAKKGVLKYDKDTQQETGFAIQQAQEEQVEKIDKARLSELTDEDMTAQVVIFLTGGFDTVATVLSFCSYELAANTEVQERLRREIDTTLKANNDKLTYDIVTQMKYLDMVVSESLRKWPPAILLDRVCTKPYTIPALNVDEEDVQLEINDTILLPCFGIHHDPEHYAEPERFDPERFSDENKHLINPYAYMPFGLGPRHCIAIRFALMEVKTVLVHVLANFEIIFTEKTQVPLRLSPSQINLNSENGIWLGLKRRSS